MNTHERLCVTPQKCAACGLISSPSPSPCCLLRGASAAGDAPKQLLALPNGPGCRWCSCKSTPINKKKARRQRAAFFFLKVLSQGRYSRPTPSKCLLLMRICRPRSADVINTFKRNVLQFIVQQSFSCSYQTGFCFFLFFLLGAVKSLSRANSYQKDPKVELKTSQSAAGLLNTETQRGSM